MQYWYSQFALYLLIFKPKLYKIKKEPEVPRAGEELPRKWMEDLVLCCGSGLQRFCRTVNVESTESYRNYGSRQKEVDRVSE